MTVRPFACAALLVVGCHGPIPEGRYPCATERDCPPAWFCHTDGLCWSASEPIDASVDGASGDVGNDGHVGNGDAGVDGAPLEDVGVDALDPVDAGWDANCSLVTYYTDCDGDGFAAPDAATTLACATPSAAPTGCGAGTWTTRLPSVGNADCADEEPHAFPRSGFFGSAPAWVGTDGDHYDYNCDGVDTRGITAHDLGPVGSCDFYQDPPPDTSYSICYSSWGATPDQNWVGAVPGCGVSGELNTCPPEVGLSISQCHSTVRSTVQACN